MITNVPTSVDFTEYGIDYLNLAWEGTMEILVKVFECESKDEEADTELWATAQRTLATSLLLTHQGCELLLKGSIAHISPFLLLSSDIKQWPKATANKDISFEDIRTIDAQDLVRLHDTVSATPLSDDFKNGYAALRKRRNTVAHGINKSIQFTSKESLKSILEIVHELLPSESWFALRRNHLGTSVDSVLYPDEAEDHHEYTLVREALILIQEFERKELIRFSSFDKRRRRYYCPSCTSYDIIEFLDEPRLGLLEPNSPKSQTLYCFACGDQHEILREKCQNEDCNGNVITSSSNQCLTCFDYQEE